MSIESLGFWLAVMTAAFVGSLHCAGMCGPIAVVAAGCQRGGSQVGCISRYQLGRLASYLILGLIAGSLGAALNLGGSSLGWQQAAAYLAGGTLIAIGSVTLVRHMGWHGWFAKWSGLRVPKLLGRLIGGVRSRMGGWSPERRALVLGLVTGALPCGWLYGFVLVAAGTGGPLLGMAVMAVFWMGSVPVLLGLASSATWLLRRGLPHATWATAGLMIVVGCLMVSQRTGWAFDRSLSGGEASRGSMQATDVQDVVETVPECCRHE